MRNIVGAVALVVLLLSSVVVATAKEVYLKDGGVVECTSFKLTAEGVVVLVNRDVLVTLSRDEVDMRRTFHERSAKRGGGRHHRSATVAQSPSKVPSGGASTAPASQKAVTPAQKDAVHAVASGPRATPPVPQGAKVVPPQGGAVPVAGQAAKTAPAPVSPAQPPKSGPAAAAPAAATPATTAGAPVAHLVAQAGAGQPGRPALRLRTAPPPRKAALPAGPIIPVFIGFLLLSFVVMVVSVWKVYGKAGEAGWKCLVPLYNLFVLLKIAGKPSWWFLLFLLPVVNIFAAILLHLALAERFGKGPLFGVGLTLVGFIFYPILAFDGSEYR